MKGGIVPMNTRTNSKGFTIIEVVLVLAIAGLIFLMVFIALPALQRSQRDSQREQDLARAQTALNSYQSNNRNNLPTNWNTFRSQYLVVGGDEFTDPNGQDYIFTTSSMPTNLAFDPQNRRIYVTVGAICGTDGSVQTGQGSRKVAFRMKLEGGGVACVNN